jgi:hypothetical protein
MSRSFFSLSGQNFWSFCGRKTVGKELATLLTLYHSQVEKDPELGAWWPRGGGGGGPAAGLPRDQFSTKQPAQLSTYYLFLSYSFWASLELFSLLCQAFCIGFDPEITNIVEISILKCCTDKKENQIFLLYIRKFRMEQVQSHI